MLCKSAKSFRMKEHLQIAEMCYASIFYLGRMADADAIKHHWGIHLGSGTHEAMDPERRSSCHGER
jgi:hypothetical protein